MYEYSQRLESQVTDPTDSHNLTKRVLHVKFRVLTVDDTDDTDRGMLYCQLSQL